MQVAAGLAEPERDVPQLGRHRLELGSDALERRQQTFGLRGQGRRTLTLLGSDRLGSAGRGFLELGDVTEPLTLCAERLLVSLRETFRVLDQRFQLGEPARRGIGVTCQLLVAASRRRELFPRGAGVTSSCDLVGAAERVQDVELERRTGEATLLELARHGDQALGGCGQVLPRDGAAPCVGPRPAVAEHAACEDETRLVLGS